MSDLMELADLIEATAAEAMEWAKSNTGNGAQEIFMAQVAISGTLKLLAKKLRAQGTRP